MSIKYRFNFFFYILPIESQVKTHAVLDVLKIRIHLDCWKDIKKAIKHI